MIWYCSDLIGRLDKVKNVNLRWGFVSTCQQGVKVRDGWGNCLFVHNVIQVPKHTQQQYRTHVLFVKSLDPLSPQCYSSGTDGFSMVFCIYLNTAKCPKMSSVVNLRYITKNELNWSSLPVCILLWLLPAQDGHGFSFITAGQQGIHVVMENSQRHLQVDLETGCYRTNLVHSLLVTAWTTCNSMYCM